MDEKVNNEWTAYYKKMEEIKKAGYILAMKLMQSDIHLDTEEWAAIVTCLPNQAIGFMGSTKIIKEETKCIN